MLIWRRRACRVSSFFLHMQLLINATTWGIMIVPNIKLTSCKLCAVRWLAPTEAPHYDPDSEVLTENFRDLELSRSRTLNAFAADYPALHTFLDSFKALNASTSMRESRVELFFEIEYTDHPTWYSIEKQRHLTVDELTSTEELAVHRLLCESKEKGFIEKVLTKLGFVIEFDMTKAYDFVRSSLAACPPEFKPQIDRLCNWSRAESERPDKRTMFLSLCSPITKPLQFRLYNSA